FIFIIQPIVIIFFLYIAFRILYRNRNKFTITLSIFYFLSALGFTMNIVFLLITYLFNEPNLIVVGIVYFIASFSVIYSTIFLLLFLIHLQRESFSIISQLILLFFYGLISVILLIFPGGIDIGEHANWIPRYSLEFLILSYIYLTVAVIIPIFYFLIKIYSTFKDKPLKK
ncbi:MAG: hypothetical protein P8Y23_01805, partial [Candidatus Lokiarchaeota archaeon]